MQFKKACPCLNLCFIQQIKHNITIFICAGYIYLTRMLSYCCFLLYFWHVTVSWLSFKLIHSLRYWPSQASAQWGNDLPLSFHLSFYIPSPEHPWCHRWDNMPVNRNIGKLKCLLVKKNTEEMTCLQKCNKGKIMIMINILIVCKKA